MLDTSTFSFIDMRLNKLTKKIKSWQHNKKCLQEQDIVLWRTEIEKIDSMESQNSLTKEDIDRRNAFRLDLLNVTIKEAQYWTQRVKRFWINEGDENTNFFHKVCSARRRRN